MRSNKLGRVAVILMATVSLLAGSLVVHASDDDDETQSSKLKTDRSKLRYIDFIRVINNKGAVGNLGPQVRFTSPLNGAIVARGEGFVGAGSTNGTGFAINLEVFTRDKTGVKVDEATQSANRAGIRHADLLGRLNPDFPGLFVFIDKDLITPTGTIIRKNTNLGTLFNIAGTDDTPGPGVTVWAGWHVLESFPLGTEDFTITAAVVDETGRIGFDQIKVNIDAALRSANALTPDPSTFPGHGVVNENGPSVEIIAPRAPSAIALGVQTGTPTESNGSLSFIQVNILDIAGAGIAVDEVGTTVTVPEFGPGSILDPRQLGSGGDNRNFPGLVFTFDVPLATPSGLLVPAGRNLTPVFNIVGSEIDPLTRAVRVVADWVVGGSLILPAGKNFVTFTATVTDNHGNAGTAKRVFQVSNVQGGQLLTPAP